MESRDPVVSMSRLSCYAIGSLFLIQSNILQSACAHSFNSQQTRPHEVDTKRQDDSKQCQFRQDEQSTTEITF